MGAVVGSKAEEPRLVLEYMHRGSLFDLLRSDAPIGGELLKNILRDVTSGVQFLHNANPQVIHSDLKSSNILIDEKYRAKGELPCFALKQLCVFSDKLWLHQRVTLAWDLLVHHTGLPQRF